MKTTPILSLALGALLPAIAVSAPSEGVLVYSGYLRSSAGPPETAPQNLTFALYEAATGGSAVWTQVSNVQPDTQGWFSVALGGTAHAFPASEFLTQTWLGITVGSEAEMAPRTKLGAAPTALAIDHSGISGCTSTSQILQWSGTTWQCISTPGGGGGGVTSVATGAGLTGGPITASGTLAIDPSVVPLLGATTNTFSGMVVAPTFQGALSGNATTATTAATATTVAAGAITPNRLSGPAGSVGQVPAQTASNSWTWMTPMSPPAAACTSGQVLSWTGSAATCQTDANSGGTITGVGAGAGLTGGGTAGAISLAANFTSASGNNGTATTVARSDHRHQLAMTVAIADFVPQYGTPTLGTAAYGTLAPVKAWSMPTNSCMKALAIIPAGAVSGPTIALNVVASSSGSMTVSANYISVPSGTSPPNSMATATDQAVTATGGSIYRVGFGASFLATSTGVVPVPGDGFDFRICNFSSAVAFSVVSVQLIWN